VFDKLAGCVVVCLFSAAAQAQGIPVKVSTGVNHGVWLKADGSVWTWGSNSAGQLGIDGDHAWSPARVPGLSGIRDVAAGDRFTVALRSDGTVLAWGENEYGELGDGSAKPSSKPTQIAGLSGIVAVSAASQHALALKSDGTVWAWGKDPILDRAALPKQVEDLANVIAIAAGSRHSVALKSDGTVWVWGNHGAGDLGNGTYGISAPLPLPALSDVKAVAAGYQVTIALKRDGTVWALGYGAAGQLGNGSMESSIQPVRVSGLAGVKAVAANYMHVLALKDDGTVWSWGDNHQGEIGNTSFKNEQSAKPVRTGPLSGVVAIAAAPEYSAAATIQGIVWAWGSNENGALGVDREALDHSSVPMRVGQAVPEKCQELFACQTAGGKVIRICGDQDPGDIAKWSALQYRFGPESGPPELMFPRDPEQQQPAMFFSHEERNGDYRVTIRFSIGAYTYRVFSGSNSGAGVEVADAKGKKLSTIQCEERPAIYIDYLRRALPCDLQNPRGPAACKE
jgi:alpha-tubulin suppressor-like RCC1 family protein